MFFAAKELWTEGTAEVICSHPTPSSCWKLEPLSCTPCPRLPHSNCILPYYPPDSLCQCRAALFAPKFFQKRGMDLTVLHIPLAHSVLSESSFPDDPISPQEQRSCHAVLGCPLDHLFFGYLGCVRHPRYDKAASFAPLLPATGLSHLSLWLQKTLRDTTDLETSSLELKIASGPSPALKVALPSGVTLGK